MMYKVKNITFHQIKIGGDVFVKKDEKKVLKMKCTIKNLVFYMKVESKKYETD